MHNEKCLNLFVLTFYFISIEHLKHRHRQRHDQMDIYIPGLQTWSLKYVQNLKTEHDSSHESRHTALHWYWYRQYWPSIYRASVQYCAALVCGL